MRKLTLDFLGLSPNYVKWPLSLGQAHQVILRTTVVEHLTRNPKIKAGNTKGGSITVPLTSCLTSLDYSVLQIKTKNVSCHTADSKPVKQEVNSTDISPFSIPWSRVQILPLAMEKTKWRCTNGWQNGKLAKWRGALWKRCGKKK